MTTASTTLGKGPSDKYLDLLQKALVGQLYHQDYSVVPPWLGWKGKLGQLARAFGFQLLERASATATTQGEILPVSAYTMIGDRRMSNIRSCVERVLQEGIPGDLIETGVWRGGACIFMRGILDAYDIHDRTVWVADSFQGLPRPSNAADEHDPSGELFKYKELAISLEEVRANFGLFGLLDSQVMFLKGWFRDTLPTAPITSLAIARLDGDLYESTMDGLVNLYPKLSPGGFLIVDDYGCIAVCKKAVEDYRTSQGISEAIIAIDSTGIYWQKRR